MKKRHLGQAVRAFLLLVTVALAIYMPASFALAEGDGVVEDAAIAQESEESVLEAESDSPYCSHPIARDPEIYIDPSEPPALTSAPGMDEPVDPEIALAILKEYDPDGYYIVDYSIQLGRSTFSAWFTEYETSNAGALDSAVHEECHGFTHLKGGYRTDAIYIGAGKDIMVSRASNVTVFPTSEMAQYIPEELRTFRYETYVAPGSDLSSNMYGPFGLLNEFNAYSWGMNNQLDLFMYYAEQGDAFEAWKAFAVSCWNDRQAYAEFRYWTLRYLEYARTNHKEVYDHFLSNQNFINAYCLTQQRFESQIAEYDLRLSQITGTLVSNASIRNGVLWIGGRGFGIPDDDYLMLLDEINQPEYQAIDAEIHARQTVFKTDISAATVTIPAQAWTGSFVTPTVTVKLGGKTLKAGTDYIATSIYSEPGTAYAVIAGRGDYIGYVVVEFEIETFPFTDITGATEHLAEILWLADSGITRGWDMGDGTFEFRPYNNVARADMAAFLCRMVNGKDFVYEPTYADTEYFADVDWSTPHCREIWWLASKGISRGWTEEDGSHTFRPYSNVARCDMACFLMRISLGADAEAEFVPSSADIAYFSDINAGTSHCNAVWWLYKTGVSAGWTERDGRHTFRPYNNVARADMAAFLYRMVANGLVPETM